MRFSLQKQITCLKGVKKYMHDYAYADEQDTTKTQFIIEFEWACNLRFVLAAKFRQSNQFSLVISWAAK